MLHTNKEADPVQVNEYSLINNQLLSNYTVQEIIHQEKEHLVVPVTMIVEGVLNGSRGPMLYLAEEFGKFPESWNGIPVVINHPEVNGVNISANSPGIIDTQTVGRIYNSQVRDNKLVAEAWLDKSKLETISADTLSNVLANNTIEVSVGVFTEEEPISGVYNGESYNAITRNHRPDHLALLPGGVGACSIEDGCGIRANSKNKKGGQSVEDRLVMMKTLRDSGYVIHGITDNSAQGLKEKLEDLRELVYSMDRPGSETVRGVYNYLEEAYDGYLIYSCSDENGETYYKRNYQFNVESDKAEFTSEPIPVKKKIEYENLVQTSGQRMTRKDKEIKIMSEEKKCTPCVEKKAGQLIANKATKFVEADRDWLQSLEESVLDRLFPEEVEAPPVPAVNALSDEDQAALAYGKRQLRERRENMVKGIQANTSADLWPDAVLSAMSEDTLERVFNSVKKEEPVNFALNGGRTVNVNTSKITPLYPAGVEVK